MVAGAAGAVVVDPREFRLHRPTRQVVPYVPTDEPVVREMLKFAGVTERDVVYDLGCGDGRIVVAAARDFGARGVGVDVDPQRMAECRANAKAAGVEGRVRFWQKSFFDVDVSEATVVMLYLLPAINVRLRPKLMWELRPGVRLVANYFGMGDWLPDEQVKTHYRVLHKWYVPAWIGGVWDCMVHAPAARHHRYHLRLRLVRRYQRITGSARIGRRDLPIVDGKLVGTELRFRIDDPEHRGAMLRFVGRLEDRVLRGTCWREFGEEGRAVWGGMWRE
jgi:SAM-dependent methyltransferase